MARVCGPVALWKAAKALTVQPATDAQARICLLPTAGEAAAGARDLLKRPGLQERPRADLGPRDRVAAFPTLPVAHPTGKETLRRPRYTAPKVRERFLPRASRRCAGSLQVAPPLEVETL